jgi:predicted ATPase
LAGLVAVFARDVATVYARSGGCVAIASEHGFAHWAARGRILQGWAEAQNGEAPTGIALLRDGLAAEAATGTRNFTPFYLLCAIPARKSVWEPGCGLHQGQRS